MNIYGFIMGGLGFLAVALGAFGAHALRDILSPPSLAIWHTASQYHFWHTLALGLVLVLMERHENKCLCMAANFFIIGISIFSGSLYLLALTDVRWLGAITPLGGIALMIGWFFLALSWRKRASSSGVL
jgi:uncharacterized membrane protein YgdD (TMEM256/DUF423 family)